jgi:hypothetical protein
LRRALDAGRGDADGPIAAPSLAHRRRQAAIRVQAEPPQEPPAARDSAAEVAYALSLLSPALSSRDPDLSQLHQSPLGQALTRHLHACYPNLEEYQDLILAEVVESTRTPSGQRALLQDPDVQIDLAIRRAMVCLAQVRVALRRAVRSELAALDSPGPGDPAPATDSSATWGNGAADTATPSSPQTKPGV